MTPMGASAAMMHELFTSYMDAGFTEDQALRLLAYTMRSPS